MTAWTTAITRRYFTMTQHLWRSCSQLCVSPVMVAVSNDDNAIILCLAACYDVHSPAVPRTTLLKLQASGLCLMTGSMWWEIVELRRKS